MLIVCQLISRNIKMIWISTILLTTMHVICSCKLNRVRIVRSWIFRVSDLSSMFIPKKFKRPVSRYDRPERAVTVESFECRLGTPVAPRREWFKCSQISVRGIIGYIAEHLKLIWPKQSAIDQWVSSMLWVWPNARSARGIVRDKEGEERKKRRKRQGCRCGAPHGVSIFEFSDH